MDRMKNHATLGYAGKLKCASRCMLLLFLIAFCGTLAHAQSGAGAIQGTVQDNTGAVIPNASVHLVNTSTGVTNDTKANGSGFYSVPSLFVATYEITFSAENMKAYKTTLTLQVGQTATIDPKLSPGAVSETVTVTGGTQLATYSAPTISTTLDAARIDQLPEDGRNIITLLQDVTPGLEPGGRVNGNFGQAVEFVQDGAPLSNRNSGGPTIQPDPDSVQEVRLETTNSNAQFATPATAIVTTRAGTNRFHGSLFETTRNNYIGIAKSRTDPFNLVAPHLVRNEFGASIGGPVLIPKVYDGKDRTFFFFAYERYSQAQTTNTLATVPTVAMRNGDFSQLINSAGTKQVLYDPSTSNPTTFQRTAFLNNQIDPSRISPLAQALYAITPLPTNASNPGAAGASNYTNPQASFQVVPTITTRVDQVFNESNRAYLRYTQNLRTNIGPRSANTLTLPTTVPSALLGANSTNYQTTPIKVYSGALNYTHIFSPTLVSQLTLSNQWENDNVEGGGNTNTNYEQLLGLPNNFGETGFPQIGSTNLYTYYQGSQFNYDGSQILTNIDEDLTKTLGRHQVFFGGRYRHEKLGVLPDRNPDNVSFNGYGTGNYDPTSKTNYTPQANTGNANADFYLGAASSYSVTLNAPYLHYHDAEYDGYVQDDFHVNSKLTLNFGLRFEAHPAPQEAHNTVNGFDFTKHAVVLGAPIPDLIARGVTTQAIITNLQNIGVVFETPQQAGLPEHLINGANIVNPRLGFAFSPFKSGAGTVFRGGYGRYVYPIPLRNFYSIVRQNSPTSQTYTQSYLAAAQTPDNVQNYLLRKPLAVVAGANSTNIVNSSTTNAILPGGFQETVLNPRYPPNLVTQFNATVEQPIGHNYVARVSYIYNAGSNLDQLNYVNQPESTYVFESRTGTIPVTTGTLGALALFPYDNKVYGSVVSDDRIGFSTNNSMQANFQRLYKKGFGFQAFYTFSSAFRVGGNTFRDSQIYPAADYAQGHQPPADPAELNHFENYQRDIAIPLHRIGYNGIFDLPFGRGKQFFSGSNRLVNELLGGFEVAFNGTVFSQWFQPLNSNYGPTNPIQIYGKKYKVSDNTSGVPHEAFQWFNGFITPTQQCNIGGNLASGYTYQAAFQQPINVTVTPGVNGACPVTVTSNNVSVPLLNGTSVTTVYSPGPNAQSANQFSHAFLHGPYNTTSDASVFKVFPIKEGMFFRINVDAFNVFNIQGTVNPDSTTGLIALNRSYNTPRRLQFTARFTF